MATAKKTTKKAPKKAPPGVTLLKVGDKVTIEDTRRYGGIPTTEVATVTQVRRYPAYQKLTLDYNPRRTVDQFYSGQFREYNVHPHRPEDDVKIAHEKAVWRVQAVLSADHARLLFALTTEELTALAEKLEAAKKAQPEPR